MDWGGVSDDDDCLRMIASCFEIVFALGSKYTQGFTRLVPSLVTVVADVANVLILSQSLKTLPVGTGYAAWTGIGAVGTPASASCSLTSRVMWPVSSASG
jgi:quaternary ammonium compound-resistance protein SugE